MGWTQHQILPDMSNSQRIPISSRRLIQAHHTHTILTILHYCTYIRIIITCWIPLDLPEQTSADGTIFGAKIRLRADHPPRKIFRHHDLGASFQPRKTMFVQTRKIPVFWAFWVPKLAKTWKKTFFLSVRGVYGRCMGGVWETQI